MMSLPFRLKLIAMLQPEFYPYIALMKIINGAVFVKALFNTGMTHCFFVFGIDCMPTCTISMTTCLEYLIW